MKRYKSKFEEDVYRNLKNMDTKNIKKISKKISDTVVSMVNPYFLPARPLIELLEDVITLYLLDRKFNLNRASNNYSYIYEKDHLFINEVLKEIRLKKKLPSGLSLDKVVLEKNIREI